MQLRLSPHEPLTSVLSAWWAAVAVAVSPWWAAAACCCSLPAPQSALWTTRELLLQQQKEEAHRCHRLHQAVSPPCGAEASWRCSRRRHAIWEPWDAEASWRRKNLGARALWHRHPPPGSWRRTGNGSASWSSSSSEPWGRRGWGHPFLLSCNAREGRKQPGRVEVLERYKSLKWSANDKGIECILTWDLVILKRESPIGFYTDVIPTIYLCSNNNISDNFWWCKCLLYM